MILLTLHIVAIGAVIGVTANFAYSMGKKEALRVFRKEHEDRELKKEVQKSNPNRIYIRVFLQLVVFSNAL